MTIVRISWWLFAIVAFAMILAPMYGCSSSFSGVCGVVPLGQTDSGVLMVKTYCEAQ